MNIKNLSILIIANIYQNFSYNEKNIAQSDFFFTQNIQNL
ncbi:hypothetical protein pb186bvf_006724 [Paramecium bursaria]